MNRCGAKTRSGDPCKNAAMPSGRCRMHGGKTPQGIALPQTTTGRYSKHLPTRLLATYEAAKNDPEILSLVDEIAGLESLSVDLIQQLHDGISWQAAYDSLMAFKVAHQRKDGPGAAKAIADHEAIITNGVANDATRAQVFAAWELRRKLTESERKRRIEMHQMVTADQAALLVRTLTGIIREHVTDPDALSAIANALSHIALAGVD